MMPTIDDDGLTAEGDLVLFNDEEKEKGLTSPKPRFQTQDRSKSALRSPSKGGKSMP